MARAKKNAPQIMRPRSDSPDGALWVPLRKFGTPSQHGQDTTVGLLHLSVELLFLILEGAFPDGFEGFMLSCKSLYTIGESRIPGYNLQRVRFRHFRYPLIDGPYHIRNALEFLHAIARDPTIPLYITSADFTGNLHLSTSGPEKNKILERIREDENTNGNIRHLLEKSSSLRDAGQNVDEWLRHILHWEGKHAAAFLLTLLPNVKRLALPDEMERPYDRAQGNVKKLLDVLPVRANADKGQASLSKLRTLLPHGTTFTPNPLDFMCRFLAINSVRKFSSVRSVAEDRYYEPFVPQYERYSESLEEVELDECVLGHQACEKLTSRIPNLRRFSYNHVVMSGDGGIEWDARRFVAALQATSGKTLESLVIKVNDNPRYNGITYLTGFQVLKELDLDVELLMDYDDIYGPSDTELPRAHLDCKLAGVVPVPRLVDILPSSIENLKLSGDRYEDWERRLGPLFDRFLSLHEQKLPNLKMIRLWANQRFMYEYESSLETIGAKTWHKVTIAGVKFYADESRGPFSWSVGGGFPA